MVHHQPNRSGKFRLGLSRKQKGFTLVNTLQKQLRGLLVGAFFVAALAACGAPAGQAPTTANAPAATATSSDSGAAQDAVTDTTTAASDQVTTTETVTTAETTSDTTVATAAKLNLNTVTEAELLSTIPGFGNRMVREFMEYRPYVSIQQFRQEIGKYVDEAQVSEYEQYVYVPINVNEADAATVMQISGVDATVADALLAARPYADNAAFLAKLAEVAPGVDQAGAESYLEAQ